MDDITPRDTKETQALGLGKRIAIGIGIISTMAPALLAAFGGFAWIAAHLALLLTGIGSLIAGGVTAYVAVHRMGVDRKAEAAKKTAALLLVLLIPFVILASGCMTRTRCQNITADKIEVHISLNDPEAMSENAYPRTLNLFAQDQQVEGGADTISSGNKTPTSLLPMGDEAVKSVGEAASAIVTAGVTTAAQAAADATSSNADAAK